MSKVDFWIKRKTCRLCLVNGAKVSIFEKKAVLNNIMTYCKLEVLEDDGLPSFICASCILKIEDFSKFIIQCHESERILQANLELCSIQELDTQFSQNGNDIDGFDDKSNYFNSEDNEDFKISDKLHSNENDEKKLMESIQISKNGDEYLYYAGIKIIVNRTKSAVCKEKPHDDSKQRAMLCPICGKLVVKSLTTHMRLHGEKKHICETCSKAFPLKEKLNKHMKTHSEVRDFACAECFKKFKTKDQLKKHIYTIHSDPLISHPCSFCSKPFKNAHRLKEHLKIHTGEQNHQCPICNRKFTYKVSLTVHMRVHTGEKPFPCRYCDKSFSMSKSLKDHERLHTGEKPYECPVCDKGFMQLSNLKSHFRNNHKGIEFKRKDFLKTS